jgi:hypothetical protein
MAVIRARAAVLEQRIGVLVVNPGGPAGSGVDFIVSQSRTPFDVRGSHRSGALRCPMQVIDAVAHVPKR